MITHDTKEDKSLATQIILALDELQKRADEVYWIGRLVPNGLKGIAVIVLSQGVIVLSQGQVVIRSSELPITNGEVILGGIRNGGLSLPDELSIVGRHLNKADAIEVLRRYWGEIISGERSHEATNLLLSGHLPNSSEIRGWGVTAESILDEVLMDIEFGSLIDGPVAPDAHYLSVVKDALLEYWSKAIGGGGWSPQYAAQTRKLIDWLSKHTELGPKLERIRRTLAP